MKRVGTVAAVVTAKTSRAKDSKVCCGFSRPVPDRFAPPRIRPRNHWISGHTDFQLAFVLFQTQYTRSHTHYLHLYNNMAPVSKTQQEFAHVLARSALAVLSQRDLQVRGAQGVTLGVIAGQ